MIILHWSSTYKRAFKKTVKKNPFIKEKILASMKLLQNDPFHESLKTHKLKGILEGTWACSVDYDLRLLFDFVKNPETGETEILLINSGSHDEVFIKSLPRFFPILTEVLTSYSKGYEKVNV